MYRAGIFILCICMTVFSSCFSKKSETDSAFEKLSKLGVIIKIPDNFQALTDEQLAVFETVKMTTLKEPPFNVTPCYAYTDTSGKGLIVISELNFNEDAVPERSPMKNIHNYRKNIEESLASGEINYEEIYNDDVTTVLMAMSFEEDGDDIFLFKGLNYMYPNRFFMIDLYVINKNITLEDAVGYTNMFNSLGIY